MRLTELVVVECATCSLKRHQAMFTRHHRTTTEVNDKLIVCYDKCLPCGTIGEVQLLPVIKMDLPDIPEAS